MKKIIVFLVLVASLGSCTTYAQDTLWQKPAPNVIICLLGGYIYTCNLHHEMLKIYPFCHILPKKVLLYI